MVVLEILDGDNKVGTISLETGSVVSDPPEYADMLMNKYRLKKMSDEEGFKELSKGWSNGYWSVRKKAS